MIAPGKPMKGVKPAPAAGVAPAPVNAAKGKPEAVQGQNAATWGNRLDQADKDHRDFIETGKRVTARYKSEDAEAGKRRGKRFNVLFSNTEVLRASLYGKAAKPDVRRRFADRDPIGQAVAQVLERNLVYFADVLDVDEPIDAAVLDHLLSGRGVCRLEVDPVFSEDEAGAAFVQEQNLRTSHVFWEDFRTGPARSWSKVPWVAFRHTPDQDGLVGMVTNLPEGSTGITADEARQVNLSWSPDTAKDKPAADNDRRAEVWEVWDKASRSRIWIVKGHPKPIRVDPDPYGLTGFWPMPRPLSGVLTSETAIPKGEFATYADQADDLDEIVRRISALTKAMKRRGVYNQALKEVARLAKADDNTLIAVQGWQELTTKGGLDAQVQWEDISSLAKLLTELYRQRDMLVQAIYELTGISDVARGASDPDETAAAQQLKASFGNQRLKRRQAGIQRWVRDLYRIKAELLLTHFEPAWLLKVANLEKDPNAPAIAQALAQSELVRFSVDIETDSTIFQDAAAQQKSRTDLVKASTEYFGAWAPLLAANPALLPLCASFAQFGISTFPDARSLQDAIDQTFAALTQMAQQKAMQPPPVDPKVQAENIKAGAEGQRAQADVAIANIKVQTAQAEGALAQQKAQADMVATAQQGQRDQAKHQMELEAMALEAQHNREDAALRIAEINAQGAAARAVKADAVL